MLCGSSNRMMGDGEERPRSSATRDVWPPGGRDHAGRRSLRGQGSEDPRRDALHPEAEGLDHIRGERGGQSNDLPGVRRHHLEQLGAKSQRMLHSVEAFEHREAGVSPGSAKVLDESHV